MLDRGDHMLKLNNIVKIFPNDDRKILNQITLDANRGELIAVVGKSGSGKTTLLSIIAGLEKVTEGNVVFDNFELTTLNEDQYASFRNENVGIVFQEFNLVEELNVLDNIMLPLSLSSAEYNDNKKQAMQLLKKFRMEHIYKRLAKNLSGGEKAKVSIARAMIQNPDIILCDEPTGSLDNENASIVFQTLKQISKDKIVIVVTHDDALIEDFATRLIRIHDGVIESDQSRIPKPVQQQSTYRLKPKKGNNKAISKLLTNQLFRRNNKTTLSLISLSFSFLLMLLSTMLLFGFKYNSLESIRQISNEAEYVGYKINNTMIAQSDLEYLNSKDNIDEAFMQVITSILVKSETVTYGTTFETITSDVDQFKLKKQLIGSYPNTPNQVIISYDFAKELVGSNLSESDMINALNNVTLTAIFTEDIEHTFEVVGFVKINTKDNHIAIFYRHSDFSTWLDTQDRDSIRLDQEQLHVLFDTTKNINKHIKAIETERGIILNKATAPLEEYIEGEYRFLTSVLLATSMISIGLGIATIYMQIKNSIKNQTKKVSILIALGAQKSIIHNLFLYESLFLGVVGFMIAILLASMCGVFIDLVLSSQFIMILADYQNIVIEPVRILASGWLIYPVFFVVMMSLIYIGCNHILKTSNFYTISENLKKD